MFSSIVVIFQAESALCGGAGRSSRPARVAARLPLTGLAPAAGSGAAPVARAPASLAQLRYGR